MYVTAMKIVTFLFLTLRNIIHINHGLPTSPDNRSWTVLRDESDMNFFDRCFHRLFMTQLRLLW